MKKKAIIVDIDGTLADKGTRGPYDWQRVHRDTPIKPIVDLVQFLQGQSSMTVLFVSGRKEECRNKTKKWLQRQGLQVKFLFMRRDDDNRKDTILKKEIYETSIVNDFDVHYALDDRDQVVDMWRKIGLTCLQVADGSF